MSRQRAVTEFVESQQTKKELEVLSVASDYFLSHGYKGTSINAMARDSGISKESIYRYFSSKKQLFEAVIAKELAEYKERLHFTDFEYESLSLDEALMRTAEIIMKAVSSDRTGLFAALSWAMPAAGNTSGAASRIRIIVFMGVFYPCLLAVEPQVAFW